MPLKLTTPETITIVKDTIRIRLFVVNQTDKEVTVEYRKGTVDSAGVFTDDGAAYILHLRDDPNATPALTDFTDTILAINAELANQTAPDVYAAIKKVLYDRVMAHEGVTGTLA